jgi:hypothetical protein
MFAAKRFSCGPGAERREPIKQVYIKMFVYNTVLLGLMFVYNTVLLGLCVAEQPGNGGQADPLPSCKDARRQQQRMAATAMRVYHHPHLDFGHFLW